MSIIGFIFLAVLMIAITDTLYTINKNIKEQKHEKFPKK